METGQPTDAALFLVLYDTINFVFGDFDCRLSTYPRHTEFALAVAEFHFPSPTAIGQSNHGEFYSLMFHWIISSAQERRSGIGNEGGAVSSLVHLMKINFLKTPGVTDWGSVWDQTRTSGHVRIRSVHPFNSGHGRPHWRVSFALEGDIQ